MTAAKSKGDAAREKRLSQALRANLRRRKDQAKARDAGDPAPPETGGLDASPIASAGDSDCQDDQARRLATNQ
jgi:hypothetical protein